MFPNFTLAVYGALNSPLIKNASNPAEPPNKATAIAIGVTSPKTKVVPPIVNVLSGPAKSLSPYITNCAAVCTSSIN